MRIGAEGFFMIAKRGVLTSHEREAANQIRAIVGWLSTIFFPTLRRFDERPTGATVHGSHRALFFVPRHTMRARYLMHRDERLAAAAMLHESKA